MSYPAEVDQILALPPAEAIHGLSAAAESQWFERKSGRVQAKDLAVALVALANAEGGCIVVVPTAGRGAGAAAPAAAGAINRSLGRFPDGRDADNLCMDFRIQPASTPSGASIAGATNNSVPTPGAPNKY